MSESPTDIKPVLFKSNTESTVFTDGPLKILVKYEEIVPEFHDPSAETYNLTVKPIQPLSSYDFQLLVSAYMAHQKDEVTARNSAARRELIWRIMRWAKFYQYPCSPPQLIEADMTGLETIITMNEESFSLHGKPSISKVMLAIRTLGKMVDADCSDFKKSEIIVEKASATNGWKSQGHPCYVKPISDRFKLFETHLITCPILRQVCQLKIMDLWWTKFAEYNRSVPVKSKPYEVMRVAAANGDFVSLTDSDFIQKLAFAGASVNPKAYFNDFKRQDWPGYSNFRETVESFVRRLLTICNNTVRDIRDPLVQTDPTILSLVRLYVAEPLWVTAFQNGPPTSLEELITKVLDMRHTEGFTSYTLWDQYGIVNNAGLGEIPVHPRRVPHRLSDRSSKDSPNSVLTFLLPDYLPLNANSVRSSSIAEGRSGNENNKDLTNKSARKDSNQSSVISRDRHNRNNRGRKRGRGGDQED